MNFSYWMGLLLTRRQQFLPVSSSLWATAVLLSLVRAISGAHQPVYIWSSAAAAAAPAFLTLQDRLM
jgi:hypothetical protein